MDGKIRVLIVGTGEMAQTHVNAYQEITDCKIVAGVDNDQAKLHEFCNRNQIKQRFPSIHDALKWGQFDAASNVTPDGVHYQTTLPLIGAGKHVLCEKPLAVNYHDAAEMAKKASEIGICHTINLSYRQVPALQKAAQLVAAGDIGDVRHFEASYLQSWLTQPAWGNWRSEPQWLWRLSSKHGSNGVLGDIGIHILDYATFVVGSLPTRMSCILQTFDKADGNTIGEYVLDANDSFVLHAQLPNGALGTISATRFASGHHNDLRLRVYGEKGGLEVLFEKNVSRLNTCLGNDMQYEKWTEMPCEHVPTNYARFISAIRNGTQATPDFFRGAELQKLLDQLLHNN